jgi:hypothetical protein
VTIKDSASEDVMKKSLTFCVFLMSVLIVPAIASAEQMRLNRTEQTRVESRTLDQPRTISKSTDRDRINSKQMMAPLPPSPCRTGDRACINKIPPNPMKGN